MTRSAVSMKVRHSFDPSKYLLDIKQARVHELKRPSLLLVGEIGNKRMTLSEAANLVYEHLLERQEKDQSLHEDIMQAGIGEPQAKARMKAVIDTLLMEYRIDIDPATLIDDMTPTECVYAETCGSSLIEDLKDRFDVEEVQIIGNEFFLIINGDTVPHHRKFSSLKDVELLQDRLALCGKKPINERQPWVQSYMWNGSRLVMSRGPYSDVPSIFIRNFNVKDATLEGLVELKTINDKMLKLLKLLVKYHACILVGGSTNTGKTTTLFALCQEIPVNERIRTLEPEFEIALRDRLKGNRSILAVRKVDDIGLTMEEAFKPLLVMSPHWVILGEGRGPEISQAVQGALRGHDVMATMHTKFRESFLSDVEDMIKQDGRAHDPVDTKKRIARAFNIIIFQRIIRIDNVNYRKCTEITELSVDEYEQVQVHPLIEFDYMNQDWVTPGNKISKPLMDHMVSNGADPKEFERLGFW